MGNEANGIGIMEVMEVFSALLWRHVGRLAEHLGDRV
jgi:hypothetical protein